MKYGWINNLEPGLKAYSKVKNRLGIENGILFFDDRIVIPKMLRNDILNKFHANHDGIVKMKISARMFVWWLRMDKHISDFVTKCSICQACQPVCKEIVETKWLSCGIPFEMIRIDLFYFESRTLLIIVDAHSKFIDVRLLNMAQAND